MTVVTVWTNKNHEIRLAQLSDEPEDGTAAEQIAYMATISAYEGYSCVDSDFTGTVPDTDPSLWRWSDGQVVAVPPVPESVTPRQVRLLLLSQGLLDEVEAMIAQQDKATQITWQFALEFKRNDPLLEALAANLGLTNEQIDQFFIAAAAL